MVAVSELVIENIIARLAVYKEDRSKFQTSPAAPDLKIHAVTVALGQFAKSTEYCVNDNADDRQRSAPAEG